MKNFIYLIVAFSILNCSLSDKKLPNNFDFGETKNGTYKNDFFDLEIPFNPSWVIQENKEINTMAKTFGEIAAGNDEKLKKIFDSGIVNTAYLLAIYQHKADSAVEFNPSFVVMSENIESSPEIENGNDYLLKSRDLLKKSNMNYYFEKDIYQKAIGNSVFYVSEAKLDYMQNTIIQEYVTTVTKGCSLSFVMSYVSEEQKNDLYKIINNIKI